MVSSLLPYYEKLLNIPYALPKLDLVAVPGNPRFSGMENWGMITIAERSLYLDTVNSTSHDWASVCDIVAHEVAHLWFGDLVTMEWWSDVWLNEGFAKYWEYIGGSACLSGTDPFGWFVVAVNYKAFFYDQTSKSHPLVFVETVDDGKLSINFDPIAYEKVEMH